MRTMSSALVVMFAAAGTPAAGEKVKPDKLPKPVLDALKAKFPEFKIKEATRQGCGFRRAPGRDPPG